MSTATEPAPARALTATVVVVGTRERLPDAAGALEGLRGVVRAILISTGAESTPPIQTTGDVTAIEGLRPEYVNNAVAALRLSSMPTLVWWRGGLPESLAGLAELADRMVLDEEDPSATWSRASTIVERTALSDLRWTRLTRWRALMAHFFDIPAVREAASAFTRLRIEGSDVHAGRLFAGWLRANLGAHEGLTVDIHRVTDAAPLERVTLGDDTQALELALLPGRTCVRTATRINGHAAASRTVSLGDQRLTALIAEELRVRSRDLTFERALAAAEGVS